MSSISHAYIEEQIKKCDLKVFEGDFPRAITNARSLLEAVLMGVEREPQDQPVPYDGDLPRLWRRVQALLSPNPPKDGLGDSP